VNTSVAGFEVDALWPPQRLIAELDGYEFHRTRAAFERDRARDAELQLAGYRILRVTYRRMVNEPKAVATAIRRLLGSDQLGRGGAPAISAS
jgi:very-short-patch-repair endonuclease